MPRAARSGPRVSHERNLRLFAAVSGWRVIAGWGFNFSRGRGLVGPVNSTDVAMSQSGSRLASLSGFDRGGLRSTSARAWRDGGLAREAAGPPLRKFCATLARGFAAIGRGALCLTLLATFLSACGSSLQVTKLRSVAQPPANVAVSLTVHDQQGAPVSGLTADNFQVLEDGEPVASKRSRLQVLNAGPSAQRYALVLVDMGARDLREDGGAQLAYLVSDFVAELESHQKVAVYAFDGSKDIQRIRPFVNSDQGRKGLFTLLSYRPNETAVDLDAAIVSAVKVLRGRLRRADVPSEFGTLVLLSAGGERVEGPARKELLKKVRRSGVSTYAVAVGEHADDGLLSRVARQGYVRAPKLGQAKPALAEVAGRVSRWSASHYVVRYCSSSRGGRKRSGLRVTHGDDAREIEYTVDATGFRRGCGAPAAADAAMARKGEGRKRKSTLKHAVKRTAIQGAAKGAAKAAARKGAAAQSAAKRVTPKTRP